MGRTYIKMLKGFAYLACVFDLYSRRLVDAEPSDDRHCPASIWSCSHVLMSVGRRKPNDTSSLFDSTTGVH